MLSPSLYICLFSIGSDYICLRQRVTFSLCLFVRQQDYAKSTQLIFTKFGGKVANGPRKNQLNFVNNPECES